MSDSIKLTSGCIAISFIPARRKDLDVNESFNFLDTFAGKFLLMMFVMDVEIVWSRRLCSRGNTKSETPVLFLFCLYKPFSQA